MIERLLGTVEAPREGPTVVGLGGLHGNEPAGVRALEAVLSELRHSGRGGLSRGRFIALTGNRPALEENVRFLERDLNRIWFDPEVADTEGREQAELLEILDEIRARSSGPVYIIDLHTTSGNAPPFAVIGDTLGNRRFGGVLPVPLVLGLSDQIQGTLLEYLDRQGWVSVGFESGSHLGADSIVMASSAVWLLIHSIGLLESDDPRVPGARTALTLAADGFPRAVEVFHRHPVGPEHSFRMLPGFRSFQSVRKGELLAKERDVEVRAPEAGRLLMPLYQPRGGDGFFLARVVQIEPVIEGTLEPSTERSRE